MAAFGFDAGNLLYRPPGLGSTARGGPARLAARDCELISSSCPSTRGRILKGFSQAEEAMQTVCCRWT